MKSLISKRALFETESTGEFSKGDSVQLGDGSKGTVVDKVEREGFAGYRVEITDSNDEDQIGNVVGATAQGMKKAFQSLTQSLRSKILTVGDTVKYRAGITGKITNIEIDTIGNRVFTFLPNAGGMRQKATADKLIRIGLAVGTDVVIPKGTSFETEGVGSEYYDADIEGVVVEDLGDGLLVVETSDGNEILMTDYEVMPRAAYVSRHRNAASKQSGRVPSFKRIQRKHAHSDFGKKALTQQEVESKPEWKATLETVGRGSLVQGLMQNGMGDYYTVSFDDEMGRGAVNYPSMLEWNHIVGNSYVLNSVPGWSILDLSDWYEAKYNVQASRKRAQYQDLLGEYKEWIVTLSDEELNREEAEIKREFPNGSMNDSLIEEEWQRRRGQKKAQEDIRHGEMVSFRTGPELNWDKNVPVGMALGGEVQAWNPDGHCSILLGDISSLKIGEQHRVLVVVPSYVVKKTAKKAQVSEIGKGELVEGGSQYDVKMPDGQVIYLGVDDIRIAQKMGSGAGSSQGFSDGGDMLRTIHPSFPLTSSLRKKAQGKYNKGDWVEFEDLDGSTKDGVIYSDVGDGRYEITVDGNLTSVQEDMIIKVFGAVYGAEPRTITNSKRTAQKYNMGDKVKYNSPVGNDMTGTIVDRRELPQHESETGGAKYVVMDDDLGMEVDDIRESDIIEKAQKFLVGEEVTFKDNHGVERIGVVINGSHPVGNYVIEHVDDAGQFRYDEVLSDKIGMTGKMSFFKVKEAQTDVQAGDLYEIPGTGAKIRVLDITPMGLVFYDVYAYEERGGVRQDLEMPLKTFLQSVDSGQYVKTSKKAQAVPAMSMPSPTTTRETRIHRRAARFNEGDQVKIELSSSDRILSGVNPAWDGQVGTVIGGGMFGVYADPRKSMVMVEVDGQRQGVEKGSLTKVGSRRKAMYMDAEGTPIQGGDKVVVVGGSISPVGTEGVITQIIPDIKTVKVEWDNGDIENLVLEWGSEGVFKDIKKIGNRKTSWVVRPNGQLLDDVEITGQYEMGYSSEEIANQFEIPVEEVEKVLRKHDMIASRKQAAAFETWLMTFLDEKGIELQEFLTEDVQVGDVVQGAFMAPPNEQNQIKDTLVKIDFAYGDVRHFLKHLAQAPGLVEMVTKLHMGGSKRVGQSMYAFWSTLGPVHRYNLHVVNEDTDEVIGSGGGSTDEEALQWLKTNYPSVMDVRTERTGKKAQADWEEYESWIPASTGEDFELWLVMHGKEIPPQESEEWDSQYQEYMREAYPHDFEAKKAQDEGYYGKYWSPEEVTGYADMAMELLRTRDINEIELRIDEAAQALDVNPEDLFDAIQERLGVKHWTTDPDVPMPQNI